MLCSLRSWTFSLGEDEDSSRGVGALGGTSLDCAVGGASLRVRCGAQGSTQRSCHKFRSPAWWGPVGPGVSWKPLAGSEVMGGGYHCALVSQVHGKQVSLIIPHHSLGESCGPEAPSLALGSVVWGKESASRSVPPDCGL